jgi:polysaccharide biosynthesis protein PslE
MQHTTQPYDTTKNLRDLITVVFKHKYKIIVVAILIFLGSIFFALRIPKVYEAKSILLVKFGREFAQRPDAGTPSGFSIPVQSIMRGEISILTSRDLINSVIKQVGIEKLYPTLNQISAEKVTLEQAAIQLFEENLRATITSNSNIIDVSFTHSNPYMAAEIVNALVDAFKDKHLEVFSGGGTAFLENQQTIFQKRLRESESNLASFKEKNRVFSFEEQKSVLILQRSGIDTSLKVAQNQINEMEQKLSFIGSPKWTVDVSPELRTQLATLQQRERELLEKYTDSSRAVQNHRQDRLSQNQSERIQQNNGN